MDKTKNHFPVIFICIWVIILIAALYFVIFFNRTTIFCNNKAELAELAELIGMDFEDIEITDIQYKNNKDGILNNYAYIFVFLKESGELESKEYYFDSSGGGMFDPNMEHIPPGHIAKLKEKGIELDNIQKHGGNWKQIKVGSGITSYEIHWYQIDDSYDGKSNVVLLVGIPRKVSIKIMDL